MESNELLRRCAASPEAGEWGLLVERFGERVEQGVRRVLRQAGYARAADDLHDFVQEVYCRLLQEGGKALRGFRGRTQAEASSYLGRLAENVTRDALRRGRAEKRKLDRPALGFGPLTARVVDRSPGPEDLLLQAERRRSFGSCCRAVVPARTARRDTWILIRVFLDGWSSTEVAAACGGRLAAASVNSLVTRTRQRLAAQGLHLPERSRK
jgi:RNA polymerase sigma factor (sigma-70 family)